MSNIPRGVGAPPPPGMNSSKRGRLVCIKVRMLDDTVAVFHLGITYKIFILNLKFQHKAIGQTLLDEVCRHLNLLECDYFGLSFIDINGNHCWLDREKTILRQITNGSTDAKFYFVVKFYTPNPIDLEEEYTRYLFTMQIKRDLALGELHCSDNTASLLSAYLVQVIPIHHTLSKTTFYNYPDATYLSHTRFVPNQTLEFQKKVMDNHQNFIGMTPGESDLAMLEVARRCDFYGVKLHAAKDIDGNDAALSVMHLGIKVFRQLQLDTTFSWARIRKLSFKRKKLLVKLHPDSYQYLKETVEFSFDTRDECKNFWKKCVEHHAFFRCVQAEEPKKETRFFISKGSSFRYHGRTQKQLIDYVREHHKRREPFTRPLRSAASTRKGTYSSTYGLVSDRPTKHRNGSVNEPNQTNPYSKHQNTHSSMPHIAHISSQPADHSFSGTLDARVGTSVTRDPPTTVTQHRLRQLKRSERCISDVDTVERPQRSSCRPVSNAITVSSSNNSKEQPDLSISLPNVLSDDLQMVCKEIEMEQNDPPKSVSGDNFQQRRSSRDYDNVSEDSYRLSDHERSTRSEVGVGSKYAAATIFNSTFVARKPGSNVVKRVVAHSKSTPNSTDDEEGALKSASEYQTFRHIKEYPFVRNTNIVPIEIDGPNVDLSSRRSPSATTTTTRVTPNTTTTVTTTSKVLTSSGAVLMKPKVISSNDRETSSGPHSSRVSPESGTYGALGPLPGRVITKENMMITPEGFKEKKPKPKPPPKPSFPIQAVQAETEIVREVKTERAASHPLVHMQEEIPFSRAPLKFEEQKERKSSLSRPALISVQSEDNPDVQKCHLFNSDIPYTLTMRNVESTQSLPYSTFKDVATAKKQGYESNSLKRVSKSPEFKRRKSLDLVPRKRLPSPGNFSAQDHTISPTTPDSDVLEYLLRRRSLLGDKSAIKTKTKRTDPRRQTQPVRFDLPPSPCSPTAGGSTPFISILNDDIFDECVSESRSLHEDMDRLDKTTPHNQSISSFMSQKSRRDSEDSDVMPPPPYEILNRAQISTSRPAPPPPPPKSLAAAVKVAEMKAAAAGKMPFSGNSKNATDSPPFIDDSPKNSSASEAPSVVSPYKDCFPDY
ncbi:Protein CBR-FRM-3 [Caenorhabditis briggsae]|uniref:Protein CBR-FRM-3 n=1 Tax=Caenorhabditis briggsae TaxID=6238 RepID=A8XQS3_CAEBR|nr:Protein CBR-FRM-3 [Caenorhabditis briggsae]CAP34998.2 Protein CBR-FRM-3 [Caenorhabditis briggsae]